MTTFSKASKAAVLLISGLLGATGMAMIVDPYTFSLVVPMQALSMLLVVTMAILGFVLVAALRPYGAVMAMSMALIGGFQYLTAPVAAPVALASVADGVASVERQWDGHFRAPTMVNGRPVEMLVDTGASLVLLTYEDAAAAGLDMGALDFDAPILTANGRSHVATITLDTITIGGVGATGIKGAVAQPGMLHASLLGMSFLGAIEEATIRKTELILKN